MSESSKAPRVTTDCGVLEGSWMHTPGKEGHRDVSGCDLCEATGYKCYSSFKILYASVSTGSKPQLSSYW